MIQLPSNATITYVNTVKIDAPAKTVWALMSQIEQWPEWNHSIHSATLLGKLQPGTRFKWKAGPGTIISTLETVEAGKVMAWSGKLPGIYAVHIWRINSNGRSTTVTTEESWSGAVTRLLKGYSRKTLKKAVD